MKKYLLLLVAVFIAGYFINANSANAVTDTGGLASYGSGCMPGDKYDRTTGKLCTEVPARMDCEPGDLFSSITGKPCAGNSLPPSMGCEVLPMWSRGEMVRELQANLQQKGYYSGRLDGIYGPMTSAAVATYNRTMPCHSDSSSTVVISSVKGPQSLQPGEQGTWTVTAYDKSGNDLEYSVIWGDETVRVETLGAGYAGVSQLAWKQSATFSHAYDRTGVYYPVFSVKNKDDYRAQATLSVKVGTASKIGDINVLSPNGGETWTRNTVQTIRWKDTNAVYPCLVAPCPAVTYTIQIIAENTDCANGQCLLSYPLPVVVARSVPGYAYSWIVGSADAPIFDGKYQIQICRSDTSTCDASDSYFNIKSLNAN